MALQVCPEGTAYAVGLPACPQCGSTEYREDGDVPKITVADGPTNALGQDPDAPFPGSQEGSESSPGTSFSTSSRNGPPSSSSTPPGPLSPAPTTDSPSSTPPAATPEFPTSSTAPSTDGGTPATTSAPSPSDPPPVRAPKAEWAAHAVATGAVAPEEAEQMTKPEIVEAVNGAAAEPEGAAG